MIQAIGAFIGIVATAIMVDAPKRTLIHSGFIGALAWWLYLNTEFLGEAGRVYLCGIIVALFAQIFARILKTPVTTLLIPGFYPLVPGVALYRAIFYLIKNEQDLFMYYFKITALTAGMIALAILTIDALFNMTLKIYNFKPQKKK